MASAQEVKDASPEATSMDDVRRGCFWLNPLVKLRCIEGVEDIAVGDIVHANKLDEKGPYPESVHLQENVRWWPLSCFELVPAEG